MSRQTEIRSLIGYARALGLQVEKVRTRHHVWKLINPVTGQTGYLPRKIAGYGARYRNYHRMITRLGEGTCPRSDGTSTE